MEVAVYLRKSREEENETREETLARHERMLKDYCDNKNLIIKKIYKEVVSGENIANRPQMQRLLEDVQDKLYDGVVVIEIERLSRGNQIDQAEILDIFKKSKTKIYTLNKIYDLSSDDDFDEDFFEFGLFMSRREYKIINRRLQRGKKQAQKEGYFTGPHTPFGYTKKKINKGFVLVPDENAKIIQMIFYKFANKEWGIADIRRYLNDNKINTLTRINWWEERRIKRTLRNKVYIGLINYDTKGINGTHKGKHEPLVDEHTFNLVQERLNIQSHKVVKSKELQNPLATILKCGNCGRTMAKYHKTDLDIYSYKCPVKCGNMSSTYEYVEYKVIKELEQELKNFNYFLENYGEELENKRKQVENEKSILVKEITKKEGMVERCCEMLEEGIYTKEKYLSRVKVLEEDLSALNSNLEALNSISFDDDKKAIKTIPILENVLKEYWNLSNKERNDLLKTFIDKIEYTKTKRSPSRGSIESKIKNINLKIYLKI